ncbi:MAG: hypothetical protein ACYDA8_19035 [Deferrisomatales bacterium]
MSQKRRFDPDGLPRHEGDGVEFTWPAKLPPAEELDRLAAVVRGGLD